MSGLFSASPVNVQEAHGYMRAIQQCSTDLYRSAVTSSYCVSYRRLAINLKQPLVSPIFARCVKLRHKTAHKYRRPLSLQQRSIPVQLDQGLRSIAVRLCLSAARIQWQRTHTRLLAVAGRHASWQM